MVITGHAAAYNGYVPPLRAWPKSSVCKVKCMSERITMNPDICKGKPVTRGTRVSFQTVLEFLAAGDSPDDILAKVSGA